MDRTPSLKSMTELPVGKMSTTSFHGALDSTHTQNACAWQEGPQSAGQGDAFSPIANRPVEKRLTCFSGATAASLEQHYAATLQQLGRVKQMYHRLDSHNDDLEGAFVMLRKRLGDFRSFLLFRLQRTARELRGEVHLLRDTVSFLMAEFAENLRRHQQYISNRLRDAKTETQTSALHFCGPSRRDDYGDSVAFSHVRSELPSPSASAATADNTRGAISWEALVHTPCASSSKSAGCSGYYAKLRQALDEAVRQKEEAEQRLLQQQESYEKHLRSLKELHREKEHTLHQRVAFLERFCGRSVSNSDPFPLNRGGGGQSDGDSRDFFPSGRPSLERSAVSHAGTLLDGAHRRGGERDADSTFASVCARGEGENRRAAAGGGGEERQGTNHRGHHSRYQWDASDGGAPASQAPVDDIERRVRRQLVSSRGQTASHEKKYGVCPSHITRREEKELEAAASRLLSVVKNTYEKQRQHRGYNDDGDDQQQYGRLHADDATRADTLRRLYYVPRSPPRRIETNTYLSPVPKSGSMPRSDVPSEISMVARGLWAEKVLHERTARRTR